MSPKFSPETDNADEIEALQAENAAHPFSVRVRQALAGRGALWLSRESGLPLGTVKSVMAGRVAKADNAVAIAGALGTTVEWLVSGQERAVSDRGSPLHRLAVDGSQWMQIAEVDVRATAHLGEAVYVGKTLVRRDLVARFGASEGKVWAATMPSSLQGVASEGDTILCADPDQPLFEGAPYILRFGRAVTVRRFQMAGDDWSMADDGTITISIAVSVDGDSRNIPLKPIGRILAVIDVKGV